MILNKDKEVVLLDAGWPLRTKEKNTAVTLDITYPVYLWRKMEKNNQPITEFRGAYNFLSNFYNFSFIYKDTSFNTVEHAFQYSKTEDIAEQFAIFTANSPGMAKRLGRQVTLSQNWEDIKLDIMLDILRIKFSNKNLGDMLLKTGERELIEGNTWDDRFWGQCPVGVGENHLGKLLMQVRAELLAAKRKI